MKKIVIGLAVALFIIAPFAHAQTADVTTMTADQLRLYIITLIEQLIGLENQLIAMQNASSSVPVAPVPQIGATTTTGTGGGTGTETVTVTDTPAISQPTIMETKTISVAFNATDTDAYVTISNNTGVAVRVKNLNVPGGAIAGITIGKNYGEGFVYPESFTDSLGKTFDVFTCNGLGSLGTAVVPGNANLDPCVRKDAPVAKNELRPGEQMIIRYVGTPSGVTYQAGSIVEVESGNDVSF